MRTSILRFLAAIFMTWLLASPAFADLTGDVQGIVTDSTGASVVGAKVTIKSTSTGQVRLLTTGQGGEFSAPQMEI